MLVQQLNTAPTPPPETGIAPLQLRSPSSVNFTLQEFIMWTIFYAHSVERGRGGSAEKVGNWAVKVTAVAPLAMPGCKDKIYLRQFLLRPLVH